jgi:hypothetical protein
LEAVHKLLALLRQGFAVNADKPYAVGLTQLALQRIEDLLVVCEHYKLASVAAVSAAAAAGASSSCCSAAACFTIAVWLLLFTICCCCCLEAWQLLHKLHHAFHLGLTCAH